MKLIASRRDFSSLEWIRVAHLLDEIMLIVIMAEWKV
jgi:hypothetical protein